MRAVRIHEFGGPDVLAMGDIPRPAPREGEVRVRMIAVSLGALALKESLHEGVV
jgi:NADPH:quinone reductase-like Zn-dependent oxidoreductase